MYLIWVVGLRLQDVEDLKYKSRLGAESSCARVTSLVGPQYKSQKLVALLLGTLKKRKVLKPPRVYSVCGVSGDSPATWPHEDVLHA